MRGRLNFYYPSGRALRGVLLRRVNPRNARWRGSDPNLIEPHFLHGPKPPPNTKKGVQTTSNSEKTCFLSRPPLKKYPDHLKVEDREFEVWANEIGPFFELSRSWQLQEVDRKPLFLTIFLKTTHQELSNAPLMVKIGHREGFVWIFVPHFFGVVSGLGTVQNRQLPEFLVSFYHRLLGGLYAYW